MCPLEKLAQKTAGAYIDLIWIVNAVAEQLTAAHYNRFDAFGPRERRDKKKRSKFESKLHKRRTNRNSQCPVNEFESLDGKV